ncbi:MAG TPA: ParB/RepB/Spo0J family partition protein [Spongiibacteraceae bacterium]|jgi:ParB family chromosome partitioning protein|nr:ParB/RepB/Spo0J family partition protein [Spongiibacteraceae bacterium]HUH38440.1 ParB/RepB/Spo0J family partition protein [Spongiibacteraceae bacterium]
MAKKRGLGRGLDALLGGAASPAAPAAMDAPTTGPKDGALAELPVELIQRGKYQPRRDMDQDALADLAASIKAQGVMQPIMVRPIGGDRYEIIAGERRWRASQLAGLDTVPVVVRDVPDEAAIAMALIENIQREDLNPMEEALALARLQREFELTHQEIADAVGKSRTTVTNLLRLTSLREEVQRMLEHGDLEMGHARALLALQAEQQTATASQVVGRGLSVRQTEALVRRLLKEKEQEAERPAGQAPGRIDPDIRQLQDQLADKLGARVQIQHSAKGAGKLILSYNSLDELDGILNHIK